MYKNIYKNKNIMDFFIKKIEKDEILVKSINRYFFKSSSFVVYTKSILIPILLTILGWCIIKDNRFNLGNGYINSLMIICPVLCNYFIFKFLKKDLKNRKNFIKNKLNLLKIHKLETEDFEYIKSNFSENELIFLLYYMKKDNLIVEDIISYSRKYLSINESNKIKNNDESIIELDKYIDNINNEIHSNYESSLNKKNNLLLIKDIVDKMGLEK